MIESSISLNIFSESPKREREKKKQVLPLNKDDHSKGNISVGLHAKEYQPVSEKKKFKAPQKRFTVWKALKGKSEESSDGITLDAVSTTDTAAKKSKKNMRPDDNKEKSNSNSGTNASWKSSRLFTGNPSVPDVPQRAVQPIKEAVFSSKAFKDLDIHPFMVKNIEENLKLTTMTAVQEKLIPVLLRGDDALVRSQTGSGKTLAFAVPLIQMLQAMRPKVNRADGVFVLIVVPSRELALQTQEVLTHLVRSFTWLVPGILMGGEKRKSEKARLRKGITILTCTPGRLLDHVLHTKTLSLARVKYLILDEADRLLDMGYEKDVASIILALDEQAPRATNKRQTVLLSATLTPGVERLAGLTLTDPVRVDTCDDSLLGTVPVEEGDESQEALVLPDTLSHSYIVTPAKLRLVTLAAFILEKCKLEGGSKIIVFMATQDMIDFHTSLFNSGLELFCRDGLDLELVKLHGNMAQSERTQVFNSFRRASSGVLLCTDVASRGLDLPEVDWVIQYNGPTSVSDYVHRVGRTARRGETGAAVLFLTTTEIEFLLRLEAGRVRLRQQKMEEVLRSLVPLCANANSLQEAATHLQSTFEGLVAEETEMRDSACKAYTSWVRFYASYPRNLKECFSIKSIHLGHFAKSFALREPPTSASMHARSIAVPKRHGNKRERDDNRKKSKHKPMKRKVQISEFDSGLEPIVKKKKKKI